jgi:cell division protein FtsI (penicillin-binding protein 3)
VAKRPGRPADSGRFAFLFLALAVLFGVVAFRLVWVQVVAAPAYADKAKAQRMRDIEIAPRRGTIYDREGEPLAVSVEAKTIYAAPNAVKDKTGTAAALASVLGGDPSVYQAKLERKGWFVYIARKVDLDQAKALEKLKLEGIGFIDDSRRLYPSGELACQVLGFVGVEDKGLAGIERQYQDYLGGKPGVLLGERDPYGRPIPGGIQKSIQPVDGHDVVLTIDKDIQYHAQMELAQAVKDWGAKSGSVVVMNPKNGEVYAIASVPGFNPNDYGKAAPGAIRAKALVDSYEPGSTIKSLTAAAVIERGLFTPQTVLELPPTLKVGGRTIHESHARGTVHWSVTDIVTNSSNIGAVKLGMKLGKDGLYDYFRRFGLTEKTGIDFPGEAKGWLPPTSQWSASSIANIPFGQGVSVTPLQLARAIGAIANGGELVSPHLLLEVPGDKAAAHTWPKRRAIEASTAKTTNAILRAVVTEGTGTGAAVPGYSVAGKTGTAQKAVAGAKGYAAGKYIGSFIGYLPAEDPQVLICVTIDEPSNAIYGGTVAAPTFRRIAEFSMAHLKIPPVTNSADTTASAGVSAGVSGSGKPAKPARSTTSTQSVGPVSAKGTRD